MFPFVPASPAQLMQLGLRSSVMLAEAQAVMAMRFFGMCGLWPVTPQENSRMVTEKIQAMHESQAAALRAVMKGASAAGVAEAALRPVRRRTRANAGRLARQKG